MTIQKFLLHTLFILIAQSALAQSTIQQQFVSAGNDVAEIRLVLYTNMRFALEYSELKSSEQYVFKGKWKQNSDELQLRFMGWKKPDIDALAMPTGKPVSTIKDKRHTISLPHNTSTIWIAGIACEAK